MKKLLLLLIGILMVPSVVRAECQDGKVEVTLINPHGKVIELCLPENAVDGVMKGANNSGTQVITAVCPCFTREDLELLPDLVCDPIRQFQSASADDEVCNYIKCTTGDLLNPDILAMEGASACVTTQEYPGPDLINPNGCFIDFQAYFLTEEEAEACVGILQTFSSGDPGEGGGI